MSLPSSRASRPAGFINSAPALFAARHGGKIYVEARDQPKEPAMSVSDLAKPSPLGPRPPAPIPNARPLGPLSLLIRFWRNPLDTWTRFNFEWPITQANGLLGRIAVVCEPAAIKRVLID